jgi:hypothetical protein
LLCILRLQTPHPYSEGFRAGTRPTAPDPASLLEGLRSRSMSRGVSYYPWEMNKEVPGYNG